MADLSNRVERKPPRSNVPRLITDEDPKDAPKGVEVVKATDTVSHDDAAETHAHEE